MIVVSDTTPLISLLKIERLDLLKSYLKMCLYHRQYMRNMNLPRMR